MIAVNESKVHRLYSVCEDYLVQLPKYETDVRMASLVVWPLSLTVADYGALPIAWQRNVATFLRGLRLFKVGAFGCERSEETTLFSMEFLEELWRRKTRHYIAVHSAGYYGNARFNFR